MKRHRCEIEWHYVKDEPIPKDGRRVFLARKDPVTGNTYVVVPFYAIDNADTEVFCKPEEYYAWADFNLVPPPYPGEEAKDVAV